MRPFGLSFLGLGWDTMMSREDLGHHGSVRSISCGGSQQRCRVRAPKVFHGLKTCFWQSQASQGSSAKELPEARLGVQDTA